MDDTEALKKTLETRAKEKTTDSIKTYFGARWKVEEELEQINSTTKEYISYVKIDGTSFKRKLQDFQLESYKKTIEESLQQTYYEEQRMQLNKILKAA